MMANLLELARALSPEQRAQAYERMMRPDGDKQFAAALALADPHVKMKYIDLHPKPGQLVAHRTQDASGRIITKYHGDPRAWRRQFDAPPLRFSVNDPRG